FPEPSFVTESQRFPPSPYMPLVVMLRTLLHFSLWIAISLSVIRQLSRRYIRGLLHYRARPCICPANRCADTRMLAAPCSSRSIHNSQFDAVCVDFTAVFFHISRLPTVRYTRRNWGKRTGS